LRVDLGNLRSCSWVAVGHWGSEWCYNKLPALVVGRNEAFFASGWVFGCTRGWCSAWHRRQSAAGFIFVVFIAIVFAVLVAFLVRADNYRWDNTVVLAVAALFVSLIFIFVVVCHGKRWGWGDV
jgi:hypothetical protein